MRNVIKSTAREVQRFRALMDAAKDQGTIYPASHLESMKRMLAVMIKSEMGEKHETDKG